MASTHPTANSPMTFRPVPDRGPVRLHLLTWLRLEPDNQFGNRRWYQRAYELLHPRLAALISSLLDLSEQNCRRDPRTRAGAQGAVFQQGDATALPYADASFD